MIRVMLAVVAVALGLSGCATRPAYVALSQENAKKIQTIEARSVVVPDEVIAKADPSMVASGAGAGGGLIGALVGAAIDASVTRTRQERIQGAMDVFYAAVEDYDFRADYWPQLTAHLNANLPYKISRIVTTPRSLGFKEWSENMKPKLGANEAFLILFTDYSLSSDLRSVNVSVGASLWLKDQEDAIYRNRINYQSEPLGNGGEDSAMAWAKEGGKPFYDKLKEGMRETMAMLTADMKVHTPPAKPEPIEVKYNFGENVPASRQNLKGSIVERRGDRIVLRDTIGYLYSVKP